MWWYHRSSFPTGPLPKSRKRRRTRVRTRTRRRRRRTRRRRRRGGELLTKKVEDGHWTRGGVRGRKGRDRQNGE